MLQSCISQFYEAEVEVKPVTAHSFLYFVPYLHQFYAMLYIWCKFDQNYIHLVQIYHHKLKIGTETTPSNCAILDVTIEQHQHHEHKKALYSMPKCGNKLQIKCTFNCSIIF